MQRGITFSIFVIDFILTSGFASANRLGIRLFFSHLLNPKPYKIELFKRVILLGAGTTGEFICKEILNDSDHHMDPVGFLDDDCTLHEREIHGRRVIGNIELLPDLFEIYDEALICCPKASRKKMQRIIEKEYLLTSNESLKYIKV